MDYQKRYFELKGAMGILLQFADFDEAFDFIKKHIPKGRMDKELGITLRKFYEGVRALGEFERSFSEEAKLEQAIKN